MIAYTQELDKLFIKNYHSGNLTEFCNFYILNLIVKFMHRPSVLLNRIFRALANQHRRAIVYHLSLQPASITELAQAEKLSLPAIHKHIAILEQAGLVERRKSGRINFLALNRQALIGLQQWITQYHPYWGNQKESLENYVSGISQRSQRIKS